MARGMKVTDDYKPMSTCGKACHNSAVCTIAIINVIDFCLGGIFIAFAVYLYSKLGDNFMNPNTAWLGWCCAILGILLILVVLTSFCAITSMGCRWVMAPSRMFALVVALLAIALGSAAFGLQPKFFHYLDDHGNEDGLSDSDITLVKNWFLTVAIGAFGVAVIEVIRFKLSQSFRENALELDNEFDNLLEQNAKDWNNKIATNQADREEKYNDLRSYYKAKYNTNPKTKEEQINAILLKPTVDLNALKTISRTKGGFGSNRMRTRVWPKLLNVNRYLIDDYRSYIDPHRDDTQVSCDVERSLWNFNHISAWKDSFRDKRRKALLSIIMAVLCRNEQLFYYQGFHDIVSIFLLVLEEDHLTFALVESTALLYLSDYMQKDFEIVSKSMRMILVLVASVDPELANYMKAAKLEPYFATSWLITWFAHDIKSIDDIARIYDVFLCSHPLFSYYVCAAYVVHLRKEIMSCECDFAALHNLLVHAPNTFGFPFEKILPRADEFFEKIPINKLKTLCDGELLKLIVNNQIICLSRPHWVMHKSRRVDSDLTLLERLKIGGSGSSTGRFPLFQYYVNSVLASWGWRPSNHVSQTTSYLLRGDSSDDLAGKGKGDGGAGGVLSMNSLFWSIAVLVSGILTYAIVTAPPLPPTSP